MAVPIRSRINLKVAILVALLVVVLVVGLLLHFQDPLVNYYGLKMRRSALDAFLQAEGGHTNLYCVQQGPIALEDTFICFDTQPEFDHFVQRRSEIRQFLE